MENEKIELMSLPILPSTISFSSLSDFHYCPHFYKLSNIDKLRVFVKNNYSYWGSIAHKYVQLVVLDKISPEDATKKIQRTWDKYCGIFKQEEEVRSWHLNSWKILSEMKSILTENFGKYKVLKIEERLSLPTGSEQIFKGFIDLVLQLEDGKIVIIDFKSCDTTYKFNRFKETAKDYQLTLYKKYYAIKHNIPLKDISTYFITLERKKGVKKPVKVIHIGSTPKKISNATKWLEVALHNINSRRFLKKRSSCHKYSKAGIDETNTCVFYKTKYCN